MKFHQTIDPKVVLADQVAANKLRIRLLNHRARSVYQHARDTYGHKITLMLWDETLVEGVIKMILPNMLILQKDDKLVRYETSDIVEFDIDY